MEKEEYKEKLLNHLEQARQNLVWYILKKDWYIDWTNDMLVTKFDNFMNYFKI